MAEQGAVPKNLRYTKDHEWLKMESADVAVVGITDHAQHAMGDITFVEIPQIGRAVRKGQEAGAVESAKAASDIFSPVSGTVSEINEALEVAPEKVNSDPYGEGWIFKVKGVKKEELANLLTPEQYETLLKQSET